jgi:hypothetical protein
MDASVSVAEQRTLPWTSTASPQPTRISPHASCTLAIGRKNVAPASEAGVAAEPALALATDAEEASGPPVA